MIDRPRLMSWHTTKCSTNAGWCAFHIEAYLWTRAFAIMCVMCGLCVCEIYVCIILLCLMSYIYMYIYTHILYSRIYLNGRHNIYTSWETYLLKFGGVLANCGTISCSGTYLCQINLLFFYSESVWSLSCVIICVSRKPATPQWDSITGTWG